MDCGGSEKILLTLLQHIDRSKFSTSLALVKNTGTLINEIPDDVELINFDTNRTRYIIIKFINLVRYKKPDVVFSTLGHLNLLIIMLRPLLPSGIKFICRETNIPSIKYRTQSNYKFYTFLYRTLYKNYDSIICQSKDMATDLIGSLNVPRSKITIINNPCDTKDINIKIVNNGKKDLYPTNKFNLLSVGSLNYQKGHDILLNTIKRLNDDRFHLTIIGEGIDKKSLKKLVKELNISSQVDFIGFKSNPYPYMHQADLFVLSSRYEGFPNVVLEAMACGIPIVAFDSPGGITEIIIDGINGFSACYLDIENLKDKILLASKTTFYPKKIIQSIESRYSIKKILPKYEKILLK